MNVAVGVDLGGTKIAVGLVAADGAVRAQTRRETPDGPDAVVAAIADAVAELGDEARGRPVGIGAAGFVDAGRRRVLFAPNLQWTDVPLAAQLSDRLGTPVILENDANAAAWAEARFGAGAGADSMVLVTVGTGIGGGIVLDGRLVRGGFGVAGELGHLPLVPDGRPCGCGQSGCWEQYASGTALTRAARDLVVTALAAGTGAEALVAACGGDPEALEGTHVQDAAAAGDPVAGELLADLGRWLGRGLAAVAAVLDPGVVVIGGGVAGNGDRLLEPARAEFRRRLPATGNRPEAEIRPARLGSAAGLVGAADLAREAAT
ncbi:ROK family glucokinase [Sporichthya brevicatena]|uniref:Glucokinase n=1 Tax=Sporichthya brevicatena TaxID=171442 RepID=A0ABN1GT15_9ACTN